MYLRHIQQYEAVRHGIQSPTIALKTTITKIWLKYFKNNHMKDFNGTPNCKICTLDAVVGKHFPKVMLILI